MSYSAIGLFNPKTRWNIGGCLRAAKCYDVRMIAVCGKRGRELCNPSLTDTCATYKHIPIIRTEDFKSIIPFSCVPVAVDIIDGAKPLNSYVHPDRAFYIFGPEDGTLGHQITDWCKDIIYIPTKHCMNLAATVNVVLYDRLSKDIKGERSGRK